MEHIVVAVDGSAASQEALNHAVELARRSETSLTGVFVLDGGWPDYIGNDWQSSKGARQGFLDYIREEQEQQAEAARRQFENAVHGMPAATFSVQAGDPAEVMLRLAREPGTGLLVLSRRVFQVSGRPSLKRLGEKIAQKATRPLLMFP
ncbi:MAG TPA: universal stress protein [Candidatus Methylomirabilis sp.]|nr:universal stress protein [Candidatus Methylomirabilis sp.]